MHQVGPRPARRSRHRAVALIAALTAALTGFGTQAFADTPRPLPAQMTPPADMASKGSVPDGPLQVARAKAKSTGKPVTVDELTTETTLVVANPDGTVTRTAHLQPARVKVNGAWAPVDATLVKNADGTLSPKATPSGVALSGGGSGPFAALTDKKGRKLALTMPFALPKPTVSGDTATYTDVLPGVDLKATVTDQGAFREVLVVHDATAAANPQLKSLRLAVNGNGVTTSADADGNVTAKAADGSAVFNAPKPVMWDSSRTPRSARALSETAVAPAQKNNGPVEAVDTPDSSEKGPGRGAHITPLEVRADAGSLTLTPDADALSGSNVAWPLYIDPYVSPVTGGTNHYTEVKEGCPGQTLYDQAQTNGEGIGYQQYNSDCFGLYRSFYEFDISYLNSRMVISNSTLYFTETYGADNGCNNTWPVTLQLTGAIGGGTGWPGPNTMTNLGTQWPKSSSLAGGCGNHPVNFDVTNTVKQYWNNGNLTFGLYGNETKSGTNYGFMRFSTNPYIQTTYDIPPNAPGNISTTPNSQNPSGPGCDGNPGWIGMTSLNGNAANLTLNAQLSTDMSGVNLRAGYHVWDNMVNDGSGHPATAAWLWSNWVGTGGTVYTNIGGPVGDGHTYGWNVWADDGTLGGPSSPYCYFNVDLTPPTLAAVAPSAAFPALGSGNTPTGHAGDSATVTVSSTDPTPGGCNLAACINSGVQAFQYSLDANIPASGATSFPATVTNGVATANIPITVPSNQWGTHTLYVRAIDKAGNTQATAATYSFYAPWNPTAKVTAGDLTGDGVPDLLATTTDGNLTLIGGNTDPSAAPATASTPSTSPDKASGWDKYLIAHRGSVAQQAKDDLFAFQKTSGQMYVYKNDATSTPPGAAGHFSNTQNIQGPLQRPSCVATAAGDCSGYNTTSWSSVTQMTAPGTLSTAAYAAANNTTVPQAADLITVEGGKLWYYISGANGSTYFDTAYQIGTGDWNITSLVGVGNVGAVVTGTGSSATTTGGTPTLWVRNNITGAISSFPLTFDANGLPTSNIAAPTRAPLTSALKDTSGKQLCLDINNAGTADGTKAQVWGCNGSDAQSFTLGTDSTVHVVGKCLDVNQGGTTVGTIVQLWTCNNSSTQQWIPGPNPGSLLNPQSGLCLDAAGTSPQPGAQMDIRTCNGGANQNWAGTTTGNILQATQPVLPMGVGTKDFPAISTPGDVNGDGNPELYAIGTDGKITSYPGAAPTVMQAADRWTLTDANDSVRTNGLTLNGGAAFGTDATRGTVLNGNGTTAYASTTANSVNTGQSFTVSAWVKLSGLTNNSTFVSQSGTNANGFQLYYSSGAHAFAFGRGWADDTAGNFTSAYGPTTGSAAPQTGTWYHLAGVYNAANNQLTLYVNGAKAATATFGGTVWNATGQVQLGRRLYKGSYGEYVSGSVSDVRTYNSALGAPAITDDMTGLAQFGTAATLGYLQQPQDRWKLTDKKDALRSNDLTITGGYSFTSDAARGMNVLAMDGAGGTRASSSGTVIDTSKSYTVSAWAYLTNTNGYATVVGESGNAVSSFYLQYSKAFNAWTFVSPSSDSASPSAYPAAFASTPPALNTWTHLVGVYDASAQTMSLYVNGALASTASNTSAWNATGSLTIGNAKNENPFPGRISDVQVWQSALPASAVATLNSGTQAVPVQLS